MTTVVQDERRAFGRWNVENAGDRRHAFDTEQRITRGSQSRQDICSEQIVVWCTGQDQRAIDADGLSPGRLAPAVSHRLAPHEHGLSIARHHVVNFALA